MKAQKCSRLQPHTGPCNGFPCAPVRAKLEREHADSIEESASPYNRYQENREID